MAAERVFSGGLLWKLLAISLPILLVALLAVWVAIDTLAASYFTELMQRYHISPAETNQMFLDAVHRYLVWTVIAALLLATLASYLLTRRVLRPLGEMASVTSQVARGNYEARAHVRGGDELAQLAESLNVMAASLEKMDRLRRDLVADVAHELRTPLTNVRGYLEALRDGVVAPDKATYDMLHGEVQRLVALADDLLELTRADASHDHLVKSQVEITSLIHTALQMNAEHFAARKIDVSECHRDGELTVSADREKLGQAIANLVENGWRHAKPGSDFRVETRLANGAVTMSFSNPVDTVPDDDGLELIFERFYRLEPSRSRDYGGAGIGLAIVKALIAAHGGRVEARPASGRLEIQLQLPA
jgi:signal transduction histidine kinase